MPHAGICTVSARQDDERQEICVAVSGYAGMQVSASSAAEQQLFLRYLPRSRHSVSSHCQPFHSSPLTSISYFIMSHHNSRRLAGSALLGVPWRCLQALAFLGDIDGRKSRFSQISPFLAGFAALAAATCSHPWKPAGAGSEAMG